MTVPRIFPSLLRLGAIALALAGGRAGAADLIVSAAASLSNAFSDLGSAYEARLPSEKIVFNFAASDLLLRQIEQGAPADVFASADEATMDRAAAGKLIDPATRRPFASNTLVLIVGAGAKAPGLLRDLDDKAYARIAIGNPDSVPAGRYARRALADAGLWDALQTRIVPAQNVRQALDYVARGEAQAGFVYATDAALQKDKVQVALAVPTATPVTYPIAVTTGTRQAQAAQGFVAFILSSEGQSVLKRHGFSAASP
jgi:molybdate transport system substrate-binding protein